MILPSSPLKPSMKSEKTPPVFGAADCGREEGEGGSGGGICIEESGIASALKPSRPKVSRKVYKPHIDDPASLYPPGKPGGWT